MKADYYIGATHFFMTKDEDIIFNTYYFAQYQEQIQKYGLGNFIEGYWNNIISSVKSGLFDFIAHLDVLKTFDWYNPESYKEKQLELIETLAEYHHPYEINTSGFRKTGGQYPATWMIEELCRRNVPVLISDDAHQISSISENYDKAEEILETLNYKNRWKLNKR